MSDEPLSPKHEPIGDAARGDKLDGPLRSQSAKEGRAMAFLLWIILLVLVGVPILKAVLS